MSRRAAPRAAALALALVVVAAAAGCGPVALMHDTMIGPVSPIGRVHAPTVGSGFVVTETGPTAETAGEARLRPYPPDLLERLGTPHSLWALTQGLEAAIAGFSFVVRRDAVDHPLPHPQARAALRPGLAAGEVLRRLGPPELWIRRSGESLMLYRGFDRSTLALYVGVPPPAGALLPVPGLANLRFRYVDRRETADKLMLFFDDEERLVAVAVGEPPG